MKNTRIKLALVVTCLFLTSLLHAQSLSNPIFSQKPLDTIITMKGDTVLGLISTLTGKKLKVWVDTAILTFKPKEVFMAKRTQEKQVYMPTYITTKKGKDKITEIKGSVYQLSENKPSKGPKLLEVITDGEIVLYIEKVRGDPGMSFRVGMMPTITVSGPIKGISSSPFGTPKNYYLVKKSTGRVIYLDKANSLIPTGKIHKTTIAYIYNMMEDEPELIEKMENEKNLKVDKLLEYIVEYNKLQEAKGHDPARYNFMIF